MGPSSDTQVVDPGATPDLASPPVEKTRAINSQLAQDSTRGPVLKFDKRAVAGPHVSTIGVVKTRRRRGVALSEGMWTSSTDWRGGGTGLRTKASRSRCPRRSSSSGARPGPLRVHRYSYGFLPRLSWASNPCYRTTRFTRPDVLSPQSDEPKAIGTVSDCTLVQLALPVPTCRTIRFLSLTAKAST